MHDIEPFYLWQPLYQSNEDKRSPFYGRTYSEIYFDQKIYNHIIHPQWDNIGSETLFIKVLFADYEDEFMIIEMIGEWNDCLYNDIMTFKRDVIDLAIEDGITKFVLIGENVLNFHASDDAYYEEWFEDIDGGWIALINFHEHVLSEMKKERLHYYLTMGEAFNELDWRRMKPNDILSWVEEQLDKKYLP
jgi:hypothetical protein